MSELACHRRLSLHGYPPCRFSGPGEYERAASWYREFHARQRGHMRVLENNCRVCGTVLKCQYSRLSGVCNGCRGELMRRHRHAALSA